jgi:predicted peptidase
MGARHLLLFLLLASGAACSNGVAPEKQPPAETPVTTPTSKIVRPRGGGEFTPRMHSAPDGNMPYRLFVPVEYDSAQRYPLILWLHGAGGSGTDNAGQIEGDQKAGTQAWITPEAQAAHPAFVLVPQADNGWVATNNLDLGPILTRVLQIVDAVSAEYPIDPRRVYVLGQSMGGAGVWNLMSNQPQRFAAAVLVCPVIHGADRASRAVSVPTWIFMGERDGLAPVARELVQTLKGLGGTPRYTEYAGAGHDIWTRVFKDPELGNWLFAQEKGPGLLSRRK